uniref:MULE transposase domain-containing protein n=1 Tax=Bracon brevicornis TaxID=1563983 RepID=A0A6V7LCA8_9HYME
MRKRCKKTEASAVIVEKIRPGASTSVAVELPGVYTLKKNIQRYRLELMPQLLTPATMSKLQIPEEVQLMLKGEKFLQFDNESRRSRFLIVSTMENLQRLGSCRIWLSDRTFSSMPKKSSQLYNIHGGITQEDVDTEQVNFRSVPLVYVLTSSKRKTTYKRIMTTLIDLADVYLEQEVFVSDFEMAFIQAVETVFSKVTSHGCYFHFTVFYSPL